MKNVKTASPPQGSRHVNGVIDPLAGVFQRALFINFFQVDSGHHDADSHTVSLQRNVSGEHVADSSDNFSSNVEQPKLAILLATFQGQKYLTEQLDSLASQTHHNLGFSTSDDGFQDGRAYSRGNWIVKRQGFPVLKLDLTDIVTQVKSQ